MKLLSKIFLLTLIIGIAGSCTKLEESPAPGSSTTTGGGGGGGGGGGNPDIYIGLWKQTDKKKDGAAAFDANNTFTVKLDVGGTAIWYVTMSGVALNPENDNYTLKTSPAPAVISFITYGSREIVTKTATQIIWKWQDPNQGGAMIEETLTKQ